MCSCYCIDSKAVYQPISMYFTVFSVCNAPGISFQRFKHCDANLVAKFVGNACFTVVHVLMWSLDDELNLPLHSATKPTTNKTAQNAVVTHEVDMGGARFRLEQGLLPILNEKDISLPRMPLFTQ